MKAKTGMLMGMAAVGVVAMGMYLKKTKAFEKMKTSAMKMMNKNMNMDFDALYDEM